MRIFLTLAAVLFIMTATSAAWANCGCDRHQTCQAGCGCAKVQKCDSDVQLLPDFGDFAGDLLPGAECCGRARYSLCCERADYKLLCPPKCEPACKERCGCEPKCKVRCRPKGCGKCKQRSKCDKCG